MTRRGRILAGLAAAGLCFGAPVAAVAQIEQTITDIDSIATSIAAAVEQQGAATAEIARTVSLTADAANKMTSRINDVSAEAVDTGRLAVNVRDDTVCTIVFAVIMDPPAAPAGAAKPVAAVTPAPGG